MRAMKIPREVEVHRWTRNDGDDGDSFGNDHMAEWLGRYYLNIDGGRLYFYGVSGQRLSAQVGDYIARQSINILNWDYWPIAPDVFRETYEVIT